jgi:uncharacterized protein (DUF983 family)
MEGSNQPTTITPYTATVAQIISGKCPRCGKGKLFKNQNPYNLRHMLEMEKQCSNCQLDFSPEIGFYWGATYVSYALNVALSVATFVASTVFFGFMNSLSLTYVAVNGVIIILASPLITRISRILWLWMFH